MTPFFPDRYTGCLEVGDGRGRGGGNDSGYGSNASSFNNTQSQQVKR